MSLKKYFAKIRNLFKNKKENLSRDLLIYEKDLINLYNNLMLSLEKMYFSFSGERLQFIPIGSFRQNYDDLFSKEIKDDFNIYQTNKGIILRRKGLEKHL